MARVGYLHATNAVIISAHFVLHTAIEFEIGRQRGILESGAEVENETLGFDRLTARTLPMRDKEMVTDYRFFPEPNLPPLR